MLSRFLRPAAAAAFAACIGAAGDGQAQELIARPLPVAGEVIAAKGGEELQLKSEADWRSVVIRQNVIGGDALRTHALGNLALLFADRTQIRVGRNSTLVVKDVARGPNGETQLALPEGSIFARAARGGSGVIVDTPAAAAAIRGTDWSLTVQGAKTSLVVLEGVVTLSNPQGSVTVRQGEAAEALIGQTPRKITLVNFKGREQILLYRELRDSFFELSPSDLSRTGERAARARALAEPDVRRSAADWLTLAETGLYFDGPAAASRALEHVAAMRLTKREAARAELVRGFIAARSQKWREAATAFRRAQSDLDVGRRDTGAYALWIAETLGEPAKAPRPRPAGGGRGAAKQALAEASVQSFVENANAGIAVLDDAQRRYPDDVMITAGKAALLLLDSDEAAAKREIDRALAIDPEDPFALTVSARRRWTVTGDLDGALAELTRAVEIAPGSSFVWGEIALVQAERDAIREAEAAHLKAIALDPESPLAHSNYANFLIDQNQLELADQALRASEAIDPSGYLSLVTRGRLLVRQGRLDEGTEKLLAAAAVNPTYAGGQLELAMAMYRAGDLDQAQQALDNAERFDGDNAVAPLIRSAIAVDAFRADDALGEAREATRRRVAKGGGYAEITSSRQDGSTIGNALRFLELDAWARYYGDRFFDPFSSTGYFDQAIADRTTYFTQTASTLAPDEAGGAATTAFPSLIQGLLLDSLAVSGRERRTDFVHAPFVEATVGGGVSSEKGHRGWIADATLQGKVMEPTPFGYFLNASVLRPGNRFDDADSKLESGVALVGVQPTVYDDVVLFGNYGRQKQGLRLPDLLSPLGDVSDARAGNVGAAWSHVFGERNVVQAMAVGSLSEQTSRADFLGLVDQRDRLEQRNLVGAVSHLVGLGDIDLRYGAEGVVTRIDGRLAQTALSPGPTTVVRTKATGEAGRLYADALWDVGGGLQIEAGLFATSAAFDTSRGDASSDRVDPRIGAALELLPGQWLRTAYRTDTSFSTPFTLSPIATVGLTPNQAPLIFGGRVETIAARWDAEWSPRLFTAVEYQSQNLRGVTVGVPESLLELSAPKAEIDRLSIAANAWLGHGVGVFASYARTWSETRDDIVLTDAFDIVRAVLPAGSRVPFTPKDAARFGLTFVHPSMMKFTVAENYVGDLVDEIGADIDSFFTTDLSLSWEGLDKRLLIDLQALNIFDKRFDLAAGVLGQGRTFNATARLRF